MYEEFLTPETTEFTPPGAYYISGYGRFGYIVHFLMGLIFSGFIYLPFDPSAPKASFGGTIVIFSLGVGSWWLIIYSCSQFFRKSPRFVLDDNGFFYRGFIIRRYVPWSNIQSIKTIRTRSGMVLLSVRLKSALHWRKNINMDVSGMIPTYKELCDEMNKRISSTSKEAV